MAGLLGGRTHICLLFNILKSTDNSCGEAFAWIKTSLFIQLNVRQFIYNTSCTVLQLCCKSVIIFYFSISIVKPYVIYVYKYMHPLFISWIIPFHVCQCFTTVTFLSTTLNKSKIFQPKI